MDAVKKDQQRRRRERIFVLTGVGLVGGLLYLAVHASRAAETSGLMQPFIFYFFNFAIWALLLVLTLVLVFLIVRNVVKYIFERRRGVLGARLRMRLVMAFTALTLGPATVLFLLSTFILNTSIERLYEPHVTNLVNSSREVIEAATRLTEAAKAMLTKKYEADGEDALHLAEEVSRAILERGWAKTLSSRAPEPRTPAQVREEAEEFERELLAGMGLAPARERPPTPAEQVSAFIGLKRREYGLAVIAVYDRNQRLIGRSVEPKVELPPVTAADVRKALSGNQGYNPPVSRGEGAVIYAFYPVPRILSNGRAAIAGVVVVGRLISWIPEREWSDLAGVEEAKSIIQDYETLHRLELPIKTSYFLLLVFVTLIVIFLAIWFGFYMAKGITEPIQLLAEGTEMVASGRLDYRIDLGSEGDDEIAILVRAFNRMTADLSKSRSELDNADRHLRETNLELERRRRYMETVLAHVAAGVISLDAESRVSTVNLAALRMLGKSGEPAAAGRPLAEIVGPEELEVFRALMDELLNSGKEMIQRQISFTRDNRSLVLMVTVSLLRLDPAAAPGMVIVFDDMTELIRAHRAMAWREVARRIAHEIKNPLTPIQLAAQRLERRLKERLQGEDAEVFADCTRTIIQQVDELKHLVNEFSLFARLPSTQPEPSDLHQIIREVLPLYREAHPAIGFKVIEDPKLPPLELDREQMQRVFNNLLDNAVASIAGPGEIEVETMYNPQLQVVRVEIRDNGHGIPPYAKDRLFEPYYSTKPHGTGLGLTIVQRIVSDHYGYIRVTDNSPRGTKIIIELPVVLAERTVSPAIHARTM